MFVAPLRRSELMRAEISSQGGAIFHLYQAGKPRFALPASTVGSVFILLSTCAGCYAGLLTDQATARPMRNVLSLLRRLILARTAGCGVPSAAGGRNPASAFM